MTGKIRVKNLTVVNSSKQEHPATETRAVKTLVDRLLRQAREASERVKQTGRECLAVVRMDREYSLLIYVHPDFRDNPQFLCYGNITGELSFLMDYEHFRLLAEPGRAQQLAERMDTIETMDMERFLRPGTMERARGILDGEIDLDDDYGKT